MYLDTADMSIKDCQLLKTFPLEIKEYEDIYVPRVVLIPGKPIAQGRPRATIMKSKGGKPFVHMYDPQSKEKAVFKNSIEQYSIMSYAEEATFFCVLSYHAVPKSYSKKESYYGELRTKKPDGKNILSFYEDVFQSFMFPPDQYLNPTMALRYYHQSDFVVIASVPVSKMTYNFPRIIHNQFKGTLL